MILKVPNRTVLILEHELIWLQTYVSLEREEERAAETSSWGIYQEEVALPAIHLSNP